MISIPQLNIYCTIGIPHTRNGTTRITPRHKTAVPPRETISHDGTALPPALHPHTGNSKRDLIHNYLNLEADR